MNHLNPRSTDGRGMPVSPVDSQIGNHLNQQPTYSMSGILKYLQAEWARFELERANWFITKAEYEAKIATLQGREKGHNTLVNDCIRRIKMLEFSLKQERQRYYAKKTGIEIDLDLLDRSQSDQEPDDQNANNNDSQNDDNENENNEEKKDSSDLNDSKENNENIDSDVSGDGKTDNKDEGLGDSGESKKKKKSSKKNKKQKKTKNNNSNVATNEQIENNKTSDNTNENDNNLNDNNDKEKQINVNGNIPKQSEFFWRHGRQLLRQYLNEVGYTDAILDVRAKRLRALLKKNEIIWSENENQEVGNDKLKDVGKDVSPDGVGAESNNNNNSINNNNESAANNNNMVDAPLENLKTMLTQNPGNLQQNSIEANQILQDNIRQLKLDQERRGNLRTNNKSSPSDIEENMKNINEQVAAKEPHFKALFNELADQLSKPVLPDVSDRDLEGHNLEDGDRNNEGQNRSWWGNQRGSEGHVEGDVSRLGELAHIRIGKNDEVDPYGVGWF